MSRKEIGMHQVGAPTSAQAAARAVAPMCLGYLAHQSKPSQQHRVVGMAAALERAVGRSVNGRS
jgi:hypothetical protein